jgi:2-dehydro-3-deoxy-D-arabinonate dehydratase
VTFLRSKGAREYETKAEGIYDMVYEAERPEIFFKATPS